MRARMRSVMSVFSVINMPLLVRTALNLPSPVAVSTTVDASSSGAASERKWSHSSAVSRSCSRKMRGVHDSTCERQRRVGVSTACLGSPTALHGTARLDADFV